MDKEKGRQSESAREDIEYVKCKGSEQKGEAAMPRYQPVLNEKNALIGESDLCRFRNNVFPALLSPSSRGYVRAASDFQSQRASRNLIEISHYAGGF